MPVLWGDWAGFLRIGRIVHFGWNVAKRDWKSGGKMGIGSVDGAWGWATDAVAVGLSALDNSCCNRYCCCVMSGRLQKEIKKAKPFDSLEQEAALNLHRTQDALMGAAN